jgi:uncharacterized protein
VTPSDDALRFPLAGLLGEPAGSSRRYEVGPVELDLGDEGPTTIVPLTGALRVARTNRGLLARAELHTSLAETCSRCLKPIEVPLDVAIDEEVLPSVDLTSGAPLDQDEEPEVARLTAHHELDLAPLVADAIRLAEPIAPRCRPDCPGLCPVCGADLSMPGHVAHEQPIDPRLEALRDFRVDGEAETD